MSYLIKRHTRQVIRHQNFVHQKRKEDIINNCFYGWPDNKYGHYLSKNKIHCSCPLCSMKTKNDGYKAADKRKVENQNNQLKEYAYYS